MPNFVSDIFVLTKLPISLCFHLLGLFLFDFSSRRQKFKHVSIFIDKQQQLLLRTLQHLTATEACIGH